MKWSWKLARVSGIDVRMHWTFLLILAWVGVSHLAAGDGFTGVAYGLTFVLALFLCVILHEFGHALAARMYGIPTRDITLLPIGGVARLERMPEEPRQELVVAIAGPAVNVAIAAVLAITLLGAHGLERFTATPYAATSTTGFLANLLWVNVAMVVFNLLPAFPMDGGRVLRAFLALRMDYVKATGIAATVGQAMAILFGIVGLFVNPFLLFIAIFVYVGAEAEAQQVRFRNVLEGIPVRRAMMTHFRTLSPEDSLGFAAEQLLAGSQTDFPVVDTGGFRGLLRRADLVRGLQDGDPDRPVSTVMTPMSDFVQVTDTLENTMNLMRERRYTAIPVMQHGNVIGLVSVENIGELVMVQSAIEGDRINAVPETRQVA